LYFVNFVIIVNSKNFVNSINFLQSAQFTPYHAMRLWTVVNFSRKEDKLFRLSNKIKKPALHTEIMNFRSFVMSLAFTLVTDQQDSPDFSQATLKSYFNKSYSNAVNVRLNFCMLVTLCIERKLKNVYRWRRLFTNRGTCFELQRLHLCTFTLD